MEEKICVVGAGVSGLATAINILDSVPGADITVVADSFSPDTTGDVAAGVIFPYSVGDTPMDRVKKWTLATLTHASRLWHSPVAGEAGVLFPTVIMVYTTKQEEAPDWANMVYGFRKLTEKELLHFGTNVRLLDGWTFKTFMVECQHYLPWLLKRFKGKGGKVQKKKLSQIDELYDGFDVVVNCSGVRARDLVNDHTVQSIRGQIIRVNAPWIKDFYVLNFGDIYIGPGADYVTLGGTNQHGDWNKEVNEADRRKIWNGCTQLFPSLRNAQVLEHTVGLRPGRPSVRLEAQTVRHRNKDVLVVHNYGHGGSGVGLHWGCAVDAARLVVDGVSRTEQPSKAKL